MVVFEERRIVEPKAMELRPAACSCIFFNEDSRCPPLLTDSQDAAYIFLVDTMQGSIESNDKVDFEAWP